MGWQICRAAQKPERYVVRYVVDIRGVLRLCRDGHICLEGMSWSAFTTYRHDISKHICLEICREGEYIVKICRERFLDSFTTYHNSFTTYLICLEHMSWRSWAYVLDMCGTYVVSVNKCLENMSWALCLEDMCGTYVVSVNICLELLSWSICLEDMCGSYVVTVCREDMCDIYVKHMSWTYIVNFYHICRGICLEDMCGDYT